MDTETPVILMDGHIIMLFLSASCRHDAPPRFARKSVSDPIIFLSLAASNSTRSPSVAKQAESMRVETRKFRHFSKQ